MHGDVAFSEALCECISPKSAPTGSANLLVMPTLDAANIAFNLLKTVTGGVSIGPILLGAGDTAHVVTPSITVRGLINMSALAGVEADVRRGTEVADALEDRG
jgi:malate dehydrogenase (oxaloacetate-decarboxylating)(NADP+)